ncbi:hypothetical protein C5688_10610 [Methylocystis sp. MitZ-2018]|jgi:hypothetical protein|nr:hypothetical protein C5688_10610 [Methylocystis sp. MitZ-2018]
MLRVSDFVWREAFWKNRRDDNDAAGFIPLDFHACVFLGKDGLFNVEDAEVSSCSTQKMLWSLINEVPTKMGETKEMTWN